MKKAIELAKRGAGWVCPNPLVEGKGADILRKSGIQVVEGVLEEECKQLNKVFFHYICTGLPYVTMKLL